MSERRARQNQLRSDDADASTEGAPDTGPGDVSGPEPEGSRHRTAAENRAGSAADKADAPAPDDPRKPASPSDLTRPAWRYVVRRTVREFQTDDATDLAAALTYWAVLAVAPAALAFLSILGLIGDAEQVVTEVMVIVDDATQGLDLQSVEAVVSDLAAQESAGWALVAGLLVALWSASGYVNAFARAMNRIYEVDEGRPVWKLRPILLGVTFVLLVLAAVICSAMVLSGPVAEAIGAAVGLSDVAVTLWDIAKWPVVVVLASLTIAVLYYATPNVRQPRFRWITIGSFVALLVWALATAGFGLYLTYLASYGRTYGALAGVVVFLLWLWLTNNALLFGAELDAELERARELQAGIEAEETIQLPPRDTAASRRRAGKLAGDVEAGRALRLSRGLRGGVDPSGE
jgi:membrane protein